LFIICESTKYKFALFLFQLDTLIILYIYNLGFLSISTRFGPIGPSSGKSNALIAQAASGTVLSVVVCLAWSTANGHARQTTTEGTVPDAACAIKAFDSPDDRTIGPKHVEIDKKPIL
jgi:hypothetical protein